MENAPILIPTKLMDSIDLEKQAQELRLICDKYDPFAPPSGELKELLARYASASGEINPFDITNRLILLLENTLQELSSRQ